MSVHQEREIKSCRILSDLHASPHTWIILLFTVVMLSSQISTVRFLDYSIQTFLRLRNVHI